MSSAQDLKIEAGQFVGPAAPCIAATITPQTSGAPFGSKKGKAELVCDEDSEHRADFLIVSWLPERIIATYPLPGPCPEAGHPSNSSWTFHVEVTLDGGSSPTHRTGTVYAVGPEDSGYPRPPMHTAYALADS